MMPLGTTHEVIPSSVDETLKERDSTYGDYSGQTIIAQRLKTIIQENNNRLTSMQRESLDMIASKIARILNGDPDYIDSWHDIAGYAKLVEDHLQEEQNVRAGINQARTAISS